MINNFDCVYDMQNSDAKGNKRKQRVLFVDDDADVLDGLRVALRKAPFDSIFVNSPYKALEMIETDPIDVVVTDEQMPEMSGSELLASVRMRNPEIIRIILSGQANKDNLISAVNAGQIQKFLQKPISSIDLLDVLRIYLSDLKLSATNNILFNKASVLGRWEWDIVKNIYSWNKNFENIMNLVPSDEFCDFKCIFNTVFSEDRALLIKAIYDCKDSNEYRKVEHRIITPSGEIRWIAQYIDVFKYGSNEWKVVGVLQDITVYKDRETLQVERLHVLQKTLDKTVDALSRMTEYRDPYTAGHQSRVARLAVEIGKHLELEPHRLLGLEIAAKLHDIGKIYIPSEFLTKPGRLSDAEMNLIKQHPEIGYSIVRDIPFATPVSDIILQHHERIDGSGYPKGLTKHDILFEARILAVSDVFEAMSSFRPYRSGLGIDSAMREIFAKTDIFFDNDVVQSLQYLIANKNNMFQEIIL